MLGAAEAQQVPQPESQPQPAPVVTAQPARSAGPQPAPPVTAQPASGARVAGIASAPSPAVASPSWGVPSVRVSAPADSPGPQAGTAPPGIALKALERAQARLRADAGAASGARHAVQAAHIAPEMLREKATPDAPHLSGARTAGMGVLLAAAAGLALWAGLDRRAAAPARSGAR